MYSWDPYSLRVSKTVRCKRYIWHKMCVSHFYTIIFFFVRKSFGYDEYLANYAQICVYAFM
jgi:hypothetical protein